MKIKWLGHSCFLMTTDSGVKIVTDPFAKEIGYELKNVEADIVTVSHDHFDHNNVEGVNGATVILRTPGEFTHGDVRITGIKTWHDEANGTLRGENTIFLFEMDGIRLLHLGDLGCMPGSEIYKSIGSLDVLMAPIGGTYTIGPRMACDIANETHTNILIPMHYQTPKLQLNKPLLGIESLINVAVDCKIHKLNESYCTISQSNLGEDRILILEPSMEKYAD